MTEYISRPIVDGFSGFPVLSQTHQPRTGSMEWLLDAVQRHATAEQDALAQYEYLRTATDDPVVSLVMQLILEDEARHHGLLKRIEASFRDALEWTHSKDALPGGAPGPSPATQSLVDTARALVEEEHTGARYLRELAHRERDLSGGLPTALLEIMAMDSDKHAWLLQFVYGRLAARATRS